MTANIMNDNLPPLASTGGAIINYFDSSPTRLRQSQLEQEPLEKQNFDHERLRFDQRQSVRVTSNYAEQLRSEAKLF